jgi:hypothetical protein
MVPEYATDSTLPNLLVFAKGFFLTSENLLVFTQDFLLVSKNLLIFA